MSVASADLGSRSNPRVIFARVGWMKHYAGSVDERPIGGGSYNFRNIGSEALNFKEGPRGLVYGYFQPAGDAIALERVDPAARGHAKLDGVLVIFVSRGPTGQVIVGWYKNAELLRQPVKRPKPFEGHYVALANTTDVTLLSPDKRNFPIPHKKKGFGQANVCYKLEFGGKSKDLAWIDDAIAYVNSYQAPNILINPEIAAEADIADAAEKALAQFEGQGFAQNPKQRRAIENHAMAAAIRYFRNKNFIVTDVSQTKSYDLLCRRGLDELHVEVKGTTTPGRAVVLTNNEVKHARAPNNKCALFVLHSIKLIRDTASGGKPRVYNPWCPEPSHLTALSYIYRPSSAP